MDQAIYMEIFHPFYPGAFGFVGTLCHRLMTTFIICLLFYLTIFYIGTRMIVRVSFYDEAELRTTRNMSKS